MKKLSFFLVALLLCTGTFAWEPAGEKIKTQWSADVNPERTLQEYPRPQLVRSDWKSLNGLWDYAVTAPDAGYTAPDGQILVPFCIESSLSGVQKSLSPTDVLWYNRSFSVPREWKGKDVYLNFGAVDWKAEIWVNGYKVGEHTGGYAPFGFNITPFLSKSSRQTLTVKVQDGSDSAYQPRGKQHLKPQGIWYTSVSGIWQSVWLEPISHDAHIESYYPVVDIENGMLKVHVKAADILPGDDVRVEILEGGLNYDPEHPSDKVIASENGRHVDFSIQDMKYWTPDNPYLYGLRISISRNGKLLDSVNGYTAIRQVTDVQYPKRDKCTNSYHRFALNGSPVFMFGPLDQGWWPDGLYTAPTDEALKFDIVKTREMGYNMIRKHVKIEPARWYYWCDVLGLMVWQDMPCAGDKRPMPYRSEEVQKNLDNVWSRDSFLGGTDCTMPQLWKNNFYKEWGEIIDAFKVFPCIVVWVPFNEAWAQFDTPDVVKFTRSKDPSRLVNESSGGNFHFCSDIIDVHHYTCPAMNAFEAKFINVLGEFGGIGYPVKGHLWNESGSWGYVNNRDSEELLSTYKEITDMLKLFIQTGCSAAVYTQTTDVELETNGLMTYDRIVKVDMDRIRDINQSVIKILK